MNHLETYWLIYLLIYIVGFLLSFVFFLKLFLKKHWLIKQTPLSIALFAIIVWPITLICTLAIGIYEYRAVRKLHKREFKR